MIRVAGKDPSDSLKEPLPTDPKLDASSVAVYLRSHF